MGGRVGMRGWQPMWLQLVHQLKHDICGPDGLRELSHQLLCCQPLQQWVYFEETECNECNLGRDGHAVPNHRLCVTHWTRTNKGHRGSHDDGGERTLACHCRWNHCPFVRVVSHRVCRRGS